MMNKSQLAQAFDVSAETVSAWLRRGCPFTKHGRNGEAYEFSLPDVVHWRVGELVARSPAGPGSTLHDRAVELFQAFGFGQALMYRDFLDMPPEDAWQATSLTWRLMADAVGIDAHDVPRESLPGQLLDPSARHDLVARLTAHVVT